MNADFYIFGKQNGEYIQYVDDSTKDIFQNIVLQSIEQLSIYHDGLLVYYIYTNKTKYGYMGFTIVFNNAIYTNFAEIYRLFRSLAITCYDKDIRQIIADKSIMKKITKNIRICFSNDAEFVECGKSTYNLASEKSVNEKSFDTSGIEMNRHLKIRALVNSIKQYQWTYIVSESESEYLSRQKNLKSSNVQNSLVNGKNLTFAFTFAFVIVLCVIPYNLPYKNSNNILEETPTETMPAVENVIEENINKETNYSYDDKTHNNNSHKYYEEDDYIDYSNEVYW